MYISFWNCAEIMGYTSNFWNNNGKSQPAFKIPLTKKKPQKHFVSMHESQNREVFLQDKNRQVNKKRWQRS